VRKANERGGHPGRDVRTLVAAAATRREEYPDHSPVGHTAEVDSPCGLAVTDLVRRGMRGVGIALVAKALIVTAILLSFYLSTDFGNVFNLWNRWYTGSGDLASWYIPFSNWDGQYYLLLSDWGYNYAGTPDSSHAFFPLYPMLIRVLSLVLPRMAAAGLLSVLTTAGFCYFLFLTGHLLGCRSPHLAVLVTLSFPTAFYASVFYTEGLFLFLQLGFVYHYLFTRSRMAWLFAALLPLTRGTALFVAAGVFAHMLLGYFKSLREASRSSRSSPDKGTRSARKLASISFDWNYHAHCLAAFVVGGLAYLAFFGVATGDPFAGFAGQDTFAVNSISDLLNPGHFLAYLRSESTTWFGARDNLFDKMFVIAAMLGSVVFLVYKDWRLLCFYVPLVYGQAAMGIGVSFPRFWLVAVPYLGLVLARNVNQRWIVYAACAAMLGLQLFLLHKFSLNLWIA